jgi:hypothetical protein
MASTPVNDSVAIVAPAPAPSPTPTPTPTPTPVPTPTAPSSGGTSPTPAPNVQPGDTVNIPGNTPAEPTVPISGEAYTASVNETLQKENGTPAAAQATTIKSNFLKLALYIGAGLLLVAGCGYIAVLLNRKRYAASQKAHLTGLASFTSAPVYSAAPVPMQQPTQAPSTFHDMPHKPGETIQPGTHLQARQ